MAVGKQTTHAAKPRAATHTEVVFPGAHGAPMSKNPRLLFVTNFRFTTNKNPMKIIIIITK